MRRACGRWSAAAARRHASFRRKEGDRDNARYWYRKAKQAEATGPLDEEWAAIADALLARDRFSGALRGSG